MAHRHDEHSCSGTATSVRQTLEEMDFERGIWYAAQHNDADRVDHLLRKGISANDEDSAGYTALHYAARNGHHTVCKNLLARGANVNALTRAGRATALHRAATRGHIRIIDMLLEAKADADLRDADGYTALHRALMSDKRAVCKILVPLTNLQLADNTGRTVVHLAKEKGQEDLVHLLTEGDGSSFDVEAPKDTHL